MPFLPRPEVSAGVFGLTSGTLLQVVSYVDDTLVFPAESQQLFDYLVADPRQSRSTVVEAENDLPDRVPELHVTDPTAIIAAISENNWFSW